jgi:hypothetical protein
VDEHGKGLIEPPKGRASNYTIEEDRLLCQIWLAIGIDPVVGTDETRDTYWVRMKEYFDARNTSGTERTDRSLRSRWRIINTDCRQWSGALAGVDLINPSGTNDVDMVSCLSVCTNDDGKLLESSK